MNDAPESFQLSARRDQDESLKFEGETCSRKVAIRVPSNVTSNVADISPSRSRERFPACESRGRRKDARDRIPRVRFPHVRFFPAKFRRNSGKARAGIACIGPDRISLARLIPEMASSNGPPSWGPRAGTPVGSCTSSCRRPVPRRRSRTIDRSRSRASASVLFGGAPVGSGRRRRRSASPLSAPEGGGGLNAAWQEGGAVGGIDTQRAIVPLVEPARTRRVRRIVTLKADLSADRAVSAIARRCLRPLVVLVVIVVIVVALVIVVIAATAAVVAVRSPDDESAERREDGIEQ